MAMKQALPQHRRVAVVFTVAGLLFGAVPAFPGDEIAVFPRIPFYPPAASAALPPPPQTKAVSTHGKSRKLLWSGLALTVAGAAVFATAGHTVNVPQQCALVPLASFCVPAKTYTDHRQGQQLAGAAMVGTGAIMMWRFAIGP